MNTPAFTIEPSFEPYDNSAYESPVIPDKEFAKSELIIAKDCRYSLDDIKSRLNNNVLVVGGSGTGKTSTVVIPNLRQAVGSYIVSDPKGMLYKTENPFA